MSQAYSSWWTSSKRGLLALFPLGWNKVMNNESFACTHARGAGGGGPGLLHRSLVYAMLPPLLPEYTRHPRPEPDPTGACSSAATPGPCSWPPCPWAPGPTAGAGAGPSWAASWASARPRSSSPSPTPSPCWCWPGCSRASPPPPPGWRAWPCWPTISPPGQRGKAMSTAFACANLGLLLGPAFAGLDGAALEHPRRLLLRGGPGRAGRPGAPHPAAPGPAPAGPARPAATWACSRTPRCGCSPAPWAWARPWAPWWRPCCPCTCPGPGHGRRGHRPGLRRGRPGQHLHLAPGGPLDRPPGRRPPLRLGLVLATALLLAAPFMPSRAGVYPFMFALGGTCSLLMSPCRPRPGPPGGAQGRRRLRLGVLAAEHHLLPGPHGRARCWARPWPTWWAWAAMALLAAGFVCYLAPLAACRTADVREAR